MIKKWLVTGDTHGNMYRFSYLKFDNPEEIGIIILGDAGCNYYLRKKDHYTKMNLEDTHMNYYLVRGNHEERPENFSYMQTVYDEEVGSFVYWDPDYPHIHYLMDGGIYTFGNLKTLVIGGAYSIDKWYRLQMGYKWFSQEQLTADEMAKITANVKGQTFDLILTHTCPLDWEPIDLFLDGIDQGQVDKSMEIWLNELKTDVKWTVWLFGHFHANRLVRPGVEMLYTDIEDLDEIWKRHTLNKENEC